MRTRQSSGLLISLSSRHGRDSLSLELKEGKPCLELMLHPDEPSILCLREAVNDGRWHELEALRFVFYSNQKKKLMTVCMPD